MPIRINKPCSYPGCSALTRDGRCDQHPIQYSQRDVERHVLYGYKWQQRRKKQLAGHPWCEDCLSKDLYVPAVEVHHVQRHQGNYLIFVTSPLLSLCKACHSRRTALEINAEKQIQRYAPKKD